MHVNNDFQRISNISQAFETIWREKEISRIDIARKMDVYRSTISNIIDVLLENKCICEGQRGSVGEKGGRKPIFLSVNKDFGAIVGIELQPEYCNIAVVDFAGQVINTKTQEISFKSDAENTEEEFLNILDSIIKPVLKENKNHKLLGICLALPGIIDTKKGCIINSVPLKLKNMNAAEKLLNRYEIPLLLENDAKCCSWLHKGQADEEKDFICVLTREHKVDGIAVGLSVVMNDKLVNGHNYAAGEYLSVSWRKGKNGQTGLPQAVINTLNTVEDSYNEWLTDLFSTLTVMIPLLEPCKIYLHGQKNEKVQQIKNVISQRVSQFEEAMYQYGAQLEIMAEDDYEIAKGAALMYIQKLFELPYLMDDYVYSAINWDVLFNRK
ncbi:MAG: ROK family protein [Treponema sp.]|nr:ROK family protein [Treponema sp.]